MNMQRTSGHLVRETIALLLLAYCALSWLPMLFFYTRLPAAITVLHLLSLPVSVWAAFKIAGERSRLFAGIE